MTVTNRPRHGEGIIEQKKGANGKALYVASFQFQRFLDGLGEEAASAPTDTFNPSGSIALGFVPEARKQIADMLELVNDLYSKNAQLLSMIEVQGKKIKDLEQELI